MPQSHIMRTQSHSLQPRQLNRDRAMLPRPPCSERSTTPSRPSREAFLSRRWATDQHGCFHISFISIPSPCLLACLPACLPAYFHEMASQTSSPPRTGQPFGGSFHQPHLAKPKELGHARERKQMGANRRQDWTIQASDRIDDSRGFWRPHGASE